MTSDMTLTERLMRHKNRILQRQVNVKLRILENEHKAIQKEILQSQRDSSLFLTNLSNTWVGLNEYDQPDTRAMAKDSRLKTRRVSMMPINATDNSTVSQDDEDHDSSNSHTRNYGSQSEYSFPEKQPDMTCLSVLDEILQTYGKGRRKKERERKIGVLVVPNTADLNSQGRVHNISAGVCHTSGSSDDKRKSRRSVSGVSRGIRRVSLVPDNQLRYARNKISSPAYGDRAGHKTTPDLLSSQTQDAPVLKSILIPPRPQTVSQERFAHSRPLNKCILKRPQTAVALHRNSNFGQVASGMIWRTRQSVIVDPFAVLPGEEHVRKRPKTAPTKYELYGRSPAVGRSTVAGIMAEMQSRCADTRRLLDHSKHLKNKVKKLIRPEKQHDLEETDE